MRLTAIALEGVGEITTGSDLGRLLVDAASACRELGEAGVAGDDILAVAHKAVSKAEGRVRDLRVVSADARARALAERLEKDPRQIQVILDESAAILRAERGVLICETHHGFVCANAGVDASNAPREDVVILLPADPDASARRLRARIRELTGRSPGILITDSFGRAWRHGQCDVAIGCAGIAPLEDWRGRTDARGMELHATWLATADAAAAAADLARTKDGGQPAILLRGLGRHVTAADGPGAQALLRPRAEDLFRDARGVD